MINKITKFLRILQNSYYLKALLLYRAASSVEHSQILNFLAAQKIHTVVDIGSNRGQFSLVARECFSGSKIFSFEPLMEPSAIFRRVFSTDPDVILHEIAIGPVAQDMVIHISRADDSSSLLPISSLQSRLFPGTDEKETRTIQVKPLDSILSASDIQEPALLKLDVQGFELQALEGCRSLLSFFSYVYVECSFLELYRGQALAYEVINFLRENGFILIGVYHLCYDKKGVAVQGDFLFESKNRTT